MPASREVVLRVLGVIVGVCLGIVTSIWAAVLTPLYIGSVRSPLAVIVALVGNVVLTYFTYVVTKHAGLALLPGLAWVIIMFIALTKTSEGDLIVTGTWVGGLTFLCGCLGWASTGYYLIMARRLGSARKAPSGMLNAGLGAPVGKPGRPNAAKAPAGGKSPGKPPADGKSPAPGKGPGSRAKAS